VRPLTLPPRSPGPSFTKMRRTSTTSTRLARCRPPPRVIWDLKDSVVLNFRIQTQRKVFVAYVRSSVTVMGNREWDLLITNRDWPSASRRGGYSSKERRTSSDRRHRPRPRQAGVYQPLVHQQLHKRPGHPSTNRNLRSSDLGQTGRSTAHPLQ